MKQFNLTTFLIIIILGLLVYLAFKPNDDNKYLNLIKQQNEEIIKQREANLDSMKKWFNGIQIIEKKETTIRNYYNEKITSTDTLSTPVSAIADIRWWLENLGTARFK